MGALSANAATPPRLNPGSEDFAPYYKATGADVYYLGGVVCEVAGKAILTNADGVTTLGFFMGNEVPPPAAPTLVGAPLTITAADQPVQVHVTGIWWVAAAGCADATLGDLMAPTAGSDNPADIIAQAAATPFALGYLIHVDVTGTSGWIKLGHPATANA